MKGIGSLRRLFWMMMALAPVGMFLFVVTAPAQSANPKLAAMIKKAAQEGEIVYQGANPNPGLSAANMLRDMSSLTEKRFGVKIKIKIDNALSFPASTAKALTEIMAEHSDRRLTVPCGHTHGAGETQVLANLLAITGGAEYGRPAVKRVSMPLSLMT